MEQAARQCMQRVVRVRREKLERFRRSALENLILRRIEQNQQSVDQCMEAITREVEGVLSKSSDRLTTATRFLRLHHPANQIKARGDSLGRLSLMLGKTVREQLENARKRHDRLNAVFRVLGPQATLDRGFSISTFGEGVVLRDVSQVSAGARIFTQLAKGVVASEVVEVDPNNSIRVGSESTG